MDPIVVDPIADAYEAKQEYNLDLVDMDTIKDADCLVLAVAHNKFKEMSLQEFDSMFLDTSNSNKIIVDVKNVLNKTELEEKGYSYWRL